MPTNCRGRRCVHNGGRLPRIDPRHGRQRQLPLRPARSRPCPPSCLRSHRLRRCLVWRDGRRWRAALLGGFLTCVASFSLTRILANAVASPRRRATVLLTVIATASGAVGMAFNRWSDWLLRRAAGRLDDESQTQVVRRNEKMSGSRGDCRAVQSFGQSSVSSAACSPPSTLKSPVSVSAAVVALMRTRFWSSLMVVLTVTVLVSLGLSVTFRV